MRYSNVCIESFAYVLPDTVVTSDELERRLAPVYDRLKLPYGRLEMMTGIRERRFFAPGTLPSQVSAQAAEKALAASSVRREDIGCLIHASVCRDFLEPATATVVHHRLGLPHSAIVFDISNACLGMLNGVIEIANRIELGQIEAGLVVAGENGAPLVETTIQSFLNDTTVTRQSFKESFASFTIGSGAAALVVAHRDLAGERRRLAGGAARADTSANDLCRGDVDMGMGAGSRPIMRTGSEELMKAGCALAAETWKEASAALGWTGADVSRFFCHQVGAAHSRLMYESCGLDRSKDFSTYEFLGNMGSVSWPITMAIAAERGLVKPGDRVMLMGIGSGVNCIMLGVEW